MKVLISAFACTPYGGTENYYGWSAVQCLAKDHDLWVLTSGRNRPDFDRALAEGVSSLEHPSYLRQPVQRLASQPHAGAATELD